MRFSLLSLVRSTAAVGLALFALAVGLGRLAEPSSSWRFVRPAGMIHLPETARHDPDAKPRFLDSESGQVRAFPLADGERLEHASCSPWLDEDGQGQVVGLWTSRTGRGPAQVLDQVGLARFRYPSGEPLGVVPMEIIPVGPPCWFPGTTARLLFPASDGRLYQVAFEGADPDPLGHGPRPQPLEAEGEPTGREATLLRDPSWLPGPPERPTLLVARSLVDGTSGGPMSSRLGWMRLDPLGDRIESEGALDTPDSPWEQRFPVSWLSKSGEPRLASLVRDRGEVRWRLRIDSLEIDAATGSPRRLVPRGRIRAEGCLPFAPVLSADGRWLTYTTPGPSGPTVRRIETDS